MKGVFQLLWFLIVATVMSVATFGIGLLGVGVWIALMVIGAAGRVDKAKANLKRILMQDETVIAEAIQHRAFALFHRRYLVAITSSRVLMVRRGLLGGFKMIDIQWKDLLDAQIDENIISSIFGSNLAFKHLNRAAAPMAIDGVPNEVAGTIYSRAQQEEQAWEEKRRVRAMEEVRAMAGGVTVHTAPAAVPAGGNRHVEEIAKAKALFDAGAVSDAEFQEMKSKILAG